MTAKKKAAKPRFKFPDEGVELKGIVWRKADLPCGLNDMMSVNKFHQTFNISRQNVERAIKAGAEGQTGVQNIPPKYVRDGGGQGKPTYLMAVPALFFLSVSRGEHGKGLGGRASAAMQAQAEADQRAREEAAARARRQKGEKSKVDLKQENFEDPDDIRSKPLPHDIWRQKMADQMDYFVANPDDRAKLREIANHKLLLEKQRKETLERWAEQEDMARRLAETAPVRLLERLVGVCWREAMENFRGMENPLAQKCLDVVRDREGQETRLRNAAGKEWAKLADAAGGEDALVSLTLAAAPGEKELYRCIHDEVCAARERAARAIEKIQDGGLAAAVADNNEEAKGQRGKRK